MDQQALADLAAHTGKNGDLATEKAKAALKAAADAADLLGQSGSDEHKRLIAAAIAAGESALADVVDAVANAAAGAPLIKDAASLQDARVRYDDAAAGFAGADAGVGNTGDWLNRLLASPGLSTDAKAKVQAALDAIIDVRRFARAAVSAAIQVREAIDALGGAPVEPVEPVEPTEPVDPPEPVQPSTLSVRAASASVQEGDTVAFLLVREGAVDQTCSVKWTKSGTSDAADFVSGTEFTGTVAWAAGDDGAKRIEFLLAPDTDVEPTDTVVLTLSEPVGAVLLGEAATAETAIVNDDVAQPEPPTPPPPSDGKYDERLPYGGLGIGTASLLGQPGNQKVVTESSIMMLCERTGSLGSMSWQNRVNGHGRTGYSDGDGGTIDWIVRVVPDPKASTIKPGPIIGQTRRISAAATTKGWQAEYQAAGGKGTCPIKFVEIPTVRFQTPVKVKRGDMLLFTQRQLGGGAVSINNNYSTCRTFNDWSPYPPLASCRQFKGASLSVRRPEHYPCLIYGYTDGMVKGTGVIGYSAGLGESKESIEIGGNTRARQVFVCPSWADGKAVKRVVSFWGRITKEVNGSLRCRIRLAQTDGGASADEGQALSDSTLLASKVPFRDNLKFGEPTPHVRHDFANPAKLVGGKTYYVVMEVVGGSTKYRGNRCVRWLDQLPVGLQTADWALKGMRGQRTTGSGWQELSLGSVMHDIPIWLEF